MSICEKVKTYESIVKGRLGINEASILNMEFFKDTSQVNVVIQTRGENPEKKSKKMAVVLPSKVAKELKDAFWAIVYPYLEAKQVELTYHKEWSERQEELKKQVDDKYSQDVVKLDSAAQKEIETIEAEKGFEIKELEKTETSTVEEYKALLETVKKKKDEMSSSIGLVNEKLEKDKTALKEKIHSDIIGSAEKELKGKVEKVYSDYGITI